MYSFYFGSMKLPLTPSKLTVKIKGGNKTLTLVNESDINFLRQPGLTEIDFDAVLPALGTYSFSSGTQKPEYYLDAFEKLMTSCKPFRFIVSRASSSGKLLYDTNMKVSLESYTVTEDAKNGLDASVAISLKQYKAFATKTVTVQQPVTTEAPVINETTERPAESAPSVQTYTVKNGDCLWTIAKKYYGNGAEYTKIYNANKDKITNPNLINVGQVLIIP